MTQKIIVYSKAKYCIVSLVSNKTTKTTTKMKTVKQLNQEAAEWIAHNWLKSSEQILASGRTPGSLSFCLENYDYVRLNLIPDFFYAEAQKENPRWWVNERNFEAMKPIAIAHAKAILRLLGMKNYPLTLAHFTKPA